MPTIATNHNTDATRTITDLVAAQVPFFDITLQSDINTVSTFILESCNELEKCFKASWITNPTTGVVTIDLTRIADEQYYNNLQKSIIGDMSAMYFVERKIIELSGKIGVNGSGDPTLGTVAATFLEVAKAGETEVDYGQLESKNIPLLMQAKELLTVLKDSVARKLRTYGCILDVNDDKLIELAVKNGVYSPFPPLPFIIVRDCPNSYYPPNCFGCGC